MKSRSNLFLQPTSTKQRGYGFLLKETMGTFDGVGTWNSQLTDYEPDALPSTAPCSP